MTGISSQNKNVPDDSYFCNFCNRRSQFDRWSRRIFWKDYFRLKYQRQHQINALSPKEKLKSESFKNHETYKRKKILLLIKNSTNFSVFFYNRLPFAHLLHCSFISNNSTNLPRRFTKYIQTYWRTCNEKQQSKKKHK